MDSRSGEGARGGEYGSTARVSIQVTDRSGRVFRAEVYRCVNVTTDPELRQALLSGALYEVDSPHEDEPFRLALPIQYHDEELELFALVVPEPLRHREFALRQALLDEFEDVADELPSYIRNFETICGVDAVEPLEQRFEQRDKAVSARVGKDAGLAADGGAVLDGVSETLDAHPDPEQVAAIDDAWRDVEEERDRLEQERQQLDEVRARFDRERARLDEVEDELARERLSLEEMRSEIERVKLNLEQERLRLEQGAPASNAEESTQVVTDDQFIEVVEDAAASEPDAVSYAEEQPSPVEATEATEVIESPYFEGAQEPSEPTESSEAHVERIDEADVPAVFAELSAPDSPHGHVSVVDGRVVACATLSKKTLRAVEGADELSFFVQYAETDDYPLVGLLLAALDGDQQPDASVGWPLDVMDGDHELVLDRLEACVELFAVIFDEDKKRAAVYRIEAPLRHNVEWIRRRAEDRLADKNFDPGPFDKAADGWAAEGTQRLGSMRHNFRADSFEEATSPADVKLACGIVGYWSTPDKFAYLVSNRSFPLEQFEAIQSRVVRRAVQHGLCLNDELRRLAVDMGLAADSVELAERLLSEFAELSIGLRDSDLDPIEEFENWEALIELAEELGVTPDPDVLELAEASLKRAQGFQETDLTDDASADAEQSGAGPEQNKQAHAEFAIDELIVARRSETTGVTYFLPDDAVLDTFDDLASMTRDDLELLLDDAKGRLEASQMLIERFGAEGVVVALDGAEKMTAAEVAALAQFVETKAEGLEAELVRCIESGGPSTTYIAARALAGIRSTSAIPTLLEAYADDRRSGNRELLARAIAPYGEKLLPQLKRVIKKEGHDEAIILLLRELERLHEGILGELAKDRSKKVRNAAGEARQH